MKPVVHVQSELNVIISPDLSHECELFPEILVIWNEPTMSVKLSEEDSSLLSLPHEANTHPNTATSSKDARTLIFVFIFKMIYIKLTLYIIVFIN